MGKFLNKCKWFLGMDDYEEDELEEIGPPNYDDRIFREKESSFRKRNNVVDISEERRRQTTMIVIAHTPTSYEKSPKIVDDLRSGKAIVINFEKLETQEKRQVFDFVSGSVYSLDGKIQKMAENIFIIAPSNIEIEGIKEELKKTKEFPFSLSS